MADYSKLNVDELEEELEARGLPKSGNKADLVQRLEDNDRGGPAPDETLTPQDSPEAHGLDAAEGDEGKSEGPSEEARAAVRNTSLTNSVEAESGDAAFVGVDPIYQNYSNPGDAPLLSQEGIERELEDRAIENAEEANERNAQVGVTGYVGDTSEPDLRQVSPTSKPVEDNEEDEG